MRIMGNKLILVATAVAFFGYSWRRGKLNEVEFAPEADGTVPRPEYGYFAEYSASKKRYRIAFDDFEEDKPWYKFNEDGLTILAPIGARVQMLFEDHVGYLVDGSLVSRPAPTHPTSHPHPPQVGNT